MKILKLHSLALLAVSVRFALFQTPMPTRDNGNCPPVTLDLLGSNTSLSPTGIISVSFQHPQIPRNHPVRIHRYHLVCEGAGFFRNTIGKFSVLVEYDCEGFPTCPPGRSPYISQFQFDCNIESDTFLDPGLFTIRGDIRTDPPRVFSDFTTPLRSTCAYCVDLPNSRADNVHHCVSKLL